MKARSTDYYLGFKVERPETRSIIDTLQDQRREAEKSEAERARRTADTRPSE